MHSLATLIAVLVGTLRAGAPLILAGSGELVSEKSGVLNLGVEGMMLMGAVFGFIAATLSGSVVLGLFAAMTAGVATALLFAVLTLYLMTNQVASGLALTIFATGLSALVGKPFESIPAPHATLGLLPWLGGFPLLKPLAQTDPVLIFSLLLPFFVHLFLSRSRPGLVLRSIGESHDVAHALGYPVLRIRLLAVLFGGAMAGLGGAYLSLIYTPMWTENMVAGRGWIALALVVFSSWKPWRLVLGAWLFGFVTISQFVVEALGFTFPSDLLATLPYLATVVVLVLISRDVTRLKLNAPAALGRPFNAAA